MHEFKYIFIDLIYLCIRSRRPKSAYSAGAEKAKVVYTTELQHILREKNNGEEKQLYIYTNTRTHIYIYVCIYLKADIVYSQGLLYVLFAHCAKERAQVEHPVYAMINNQRFYGA